MSGLDPLGRALVKERLCAERGRGRTILLASHVLADVEALADTVSLLAEGRLLIAGSPRELLAGAAGDVTIEGSGPLAPDLLAGLRGRCAVRAGTEEWTITLTGPEDFQVDACLARLLRDGARVRRLERVREDLERFFLRRLAAGADGSFEGPAPAARARADGTVAGGTRAEGGTLADGEERRWANG